MNRLPSVRLCHPFDGKRLQLWLKLPATGCPGSPACAGWRPAAPPARATAAAAIIAEIGVDMSRFPTPGHLCSWARFAPRTQESAGRVKGRGGTGKGNPYLAAVLGEAVISLGRTETFLGARYRRIARRRGKKRALVAVGRSLLIVIWHLLNDPDASFNDLGAQHYDQRSGPARQIRNHVRQLEALGLKVTLEPAA